MVECGLIAVMKHYNWYAIWLRLGDEPVQSQNFVSITQRPQMPTIFSLRPPWTIMRVTVSSRPTTWSSRHRYVIGIIAASGSSG